MRFTSQHKAINQKEYGKAVSPLRYDSLALILCRSIFVVYGKQSEKNKYICSSKRHSALHTFWDTTIICRVITNDLPSWEVRRILAPCRRGESPERLGDYEATPTLRPLVGRTNLYH